jgi:hypothetical protein
MEIAAETLDVTLDALGDLGGEPGALPSQSTPLGRVLSAIRSRFVVGVKVGGVLAKGCREPGQGPATA